MNIYKPNLARIEKIEDITYDSKRFTIKMLEGEFNHRPGQFAEVTVFGVGEAPISISSYPVDGKTFSITVRKVGQVTSALHDLEEGASIGIRGPFGTEWPQEDEMIVVAGGIGLAPMRGILEGAQRDESRKIRLFYGARSPKDIVFIEELPVWDKTHNIEVNATVDVGDDTWKGNVGLIPSLFDKIPVDTSKKVLICGPPIMMFFMIKKLKELGFPDENIIISLERHMQCGVGKCGHCNVGPYYVCKDGPVFNYSKVKDLPELWK